MGAAAPLSVQRRCCERCAALVGACESRVSPYSEGYTLTRMSFAPMRFEKMLKVQCKAFLTYFHSIKFAQSFSGIFERNDTQTFPSLGRTHGTHAPRRRLQKKKSSLCLSFISFHFIWTCEKFRRCGLFKTFEQYCYDFEWQSSKCTLLHQA